MAWYLQYDHSIVKGGKLGKKLIELDCPDSFNQRDAARKCAKTIIEKSQLKNPLLIWQEEVNSPSVKKSKKERFLGL